MQALADALVYAVAYINLRGAEGAMDDDSDVGALESIAGLLSESSNEEQDALAAAAERALATEFRDEFLRDYKTWMEDMFGEGWVGNKRNMQQ